MIDLPEVNEGDPVSAEAYNALVQEVRRLGKLQAIAPLELKDDGAGMVLSSAEPSEMLLIKPSSMAGRDGCYYGKIAQGKVTALWDPAVTGSGGNYDVVGAFSYPTNDDAVIINLLEYGLGETPKNWGVLANWGTTPIPCMKIGIATDGKVMAVANWFPSSLFAVRVRWDGTGSDGSSSSYASWKYDIYEITNTTKIRSGASVWFRPVKGSATKASYGIAFFDPTNTGTFLWSVDEQIS